jgi:prepilin signal peptidase PulO-like enzyme (type II secretory pathway)
MDIVSLLEGIVFSGFLGLALGNFATNPIYRLPRNESLFYRDPYCGDCNTKLTTIDLFPVFSWLSTRGKCRYCGASVPGSYAVTEALIGLLFVVAYVKFGFSERFVLVSFGATAFVMIAMMLHIDNFFSGKTLVVCIAIGMVYRTLLEGTIYGFAGGAGLGLLAGVVAWKCSGKPLIRDMAAFPTYLKLLVCAGIWLPEFQLFIVFALAGLASLLKKRCVWLPEYTMIVCTVALLLIHT